MAKLSDSAKAQLAGRMTPLEELVGELNDGPTRWFGDGAVVGEVVRVDRDELLIEAGDPTDSRENAAGSASTAEKLDFIRSIVIDLTEFKSPRLERLLRQWLLEILATKMRELTDRKRSALTSPKLMHRGRVTQPFETAPPEIGEILDRLEQKHEEIVTTAAALDYAGVDPAEYQVTTLREISEDYGKLARNIGLHAIAEGRLTQAAMARIYGVRAATINSWVNEARKQTEP